ESSWSTTDEASVFRLGVDRSTTFAGSPGDETIKFVTQSNIETRGFEIGQLLFPDPVGTFRGGLGAGFSPSAKIRPVRHQRSVKRGLIAFHGVLGGKEVTARAAVTDSLECQILLAARSLLDRLGTRFQQPQVGH